MFPKLGSTERERELNSTATICNSSVGALRSGAAAAPLQVHRGGILVGYWRDHSFVRVTEPVLLWAYKLVLTTGLRVSSPPTESGRLGSTQDRTEMTSRVHR